MIIHVFKYYSRLDSDFNIYNNYFDKLTFADRFDFTKILIDSIPNYSNEYFKEDDLTVMKTGNIDINFSMISGETSKTGKNPYDFFYGDDIADSRFLCIVEFSDKNSFTGMLDNGSIKVDTDIISNKYIISISTYGMEKELFEKFKKTYFRVYVPPNLSFQNFIYTNVFAPFPQYDANRLLNITNANFLEDKCGFPLIFNQSAIPVIFPSGSLYNLDNFLKSFLPTFFCHIRCDLKELENLSGQFPSFNLRFLFRSDRKDVFTDYNIISEIETFSSDTKKFLFVKTFQYHASSNWYSGIFINPLNAQTYNISLDAGKFNSNDDVTTALIEVNGHWFTSNINTNEIEIIDLRTYFYFPNEDSIGASGNAAFIYAWQNVENILKATAGIEYKRLITAGVKTATLNINYNNPDCMQIFNQVIFKDKIYYIERLKEINDSEKTCKLDISQ